MAIQQQPDEIKPKLLKKPTNKVENFITRSQERFAQMDEKTKSKLELLRKQRQAKRLVFSALREQSDSDSDNQEEKRLRASDGSGFTALYSASKKSEVLGQQLTIDVERMNSNEYVLNQQHEFNLLAESDRVSEDNRQRLNAEPLVIEDPGKLPEVEVDLGINTFDNNINRKGNAVFKAEIVKSTEETSLVKDEKSSIKVKSSPKKKQIKKRSKDMQNFDAKGKIKALLDKSAIDEPEVYKSDSGESKYSNEDKTGKDHLSQDEAALMNAMRKFKNANKIK